MTPEENKNRMLGPRISPIILFVFPVLFFLYIFLTIVTGFSGPWRVDLPANVGLTFLVIIALTLIFGRSKNQKIRMVALILPLLTLIILLCLIALGKVDLIMRAGPTL